MNANQKKEALIKIGKLNEELEAAIADANAKFASLKELHESAGVYFQWDSLDELVCELCPDEDEYWESSDEYEESDDC